MLARGLPVTINWMISGNCNMNCPACYGLFSQQDLKKKDLLFILDKIIKSGVKKISLTGGEPMLNSNYFEIISKAVKNGLSVSLHTNGLLLTKRNIERLANMNNFRISLALDGSTNSINYQIRNVKNYKTYIEKLIIELKKKSIPISVKSIATKINSSDLINLAHFFSAYTPDVWLVTQYCPREKASKEENRIIYGISDEDFLGIRRKIESLELPYKVNFKSREDLNSRPYFFINSNGDAMTVYNNQYKRISSILDADIMETWDMISDRKKVDDNYFKDFAPISN